MSSHIAKATVHGQFTGRTNASLRVCSEVFIIDKIARCPWAFLIGRVC